MIYTCGHRESYERYFLEQGTPQKLGRTADYRGGSVWQTREEAEQYCSEDYAIYGVIADWERDTAPTMADEGTWHDLLVTSPLVRLSPDSSISDLGYESTDLSKA